MLDDFLDSIEGLPEEVRERLEEMRTRDLALEEERRALFKKRCLYLRADEKGLDAGLRASLLRKVEKEHAGLVAAMNERASDAQRMAQALRGHLSRLDAEIASRGIVLPAVSAMGFEAGDAEGTNPYAAVIEAVAAPRTRISDASASKSAILAGDSPSKRAPPARRSGGEARPGEPVYCHCRTAAYGEMVACDAPGCALEWFHYACVGLSSPPPGRWFCSVCLDSGRSSMRRSVTAATITDSE